MTILTLCLIALVLYLWHLATKVSDLEKHIKELQEDYTLQHLVSRISKLEKQISAEGSKNEEAVTGKQTERQTAAEPAINETAVKTPVVANKSVVQEIKTAAPGWPPVKTPQEQPQPKPKPQTTVSQESPKKAVINWEIFAGVKLFAWIGGFAAFLGIIFFTKYAIDSGFITPLMRVCAGFAAGIVLVTAGLFIKNEKIQTTGNVLCAIGIVFVYVSAFAAGNFYHIFSTLLTFIIMVAASAGAFAISVHKNAKYIAVLAAVGGYLTPILISTGSGAILSLSVYMAIITVTIMMIAVKKEWPFLIWLSSIGVYLILIALYSKNFVYYRTLDMAAIYAGFCALFAAFAVFVSKKYNFASEDYGLASFTFNIFSMFFVFAFFDKAAYFPLALLMTINACLFFISVNDKYFRDGYVFASVFSFLILFAWTAFYLKQNSLWFALGAYFIFFLLNGFLPLFDDYRKKIKPSVWNGIFPAALIFIAAVCMAKVYFVYFSVWILVMIAAFFALAYSEITKNIFTAFLSVFGIFTTLFVWLIATRASAFDEISFAGIACGFALGIFVLASVLKKKGIKAAGFLNIELQETPSQPLYSVYNMFFISIFILLSAAIIKIKPAVPGVFIISGLAVSLFIILLSLINESKNFIGVLFALISMFFMQLLWQNFYFTQDVHKIICLWYFIVFVFFYAAVFLLKKQFMHKKMPWFVSALAGVLQCCLIYLASKNNQAVSPYLGAIPAVFAIIYGLSVFNIMRLGNMKDEFQISRIGIFTAAALFFITLIFPMQFKTQWLIVGWTLEAAALIALFRLIAYKPLKYWGFWLLVLVFFLTVVPDVYLFKVIAGSVFNWYLYMYSIVIVSMFAGASLWTPKDEKHAGINNRITLYTLAVILLFVLVNIEIAAFFATGNYIHFSFSNSLAQDMSYTLCWGLFAIGMFVFGIVKKIKAVRISGLVLLSISTFKLFLHDLWNLGQLYRIGSLFGLAAMLILVSFLYQKYVIKKSEE
ncbi:MAG: DUF2339 domain-containing protein [Endomicrobia bacterium]|nr:DUF2339 domain-containing protein [Endomicrobiia bacterium]